ncbi:HTH_48 domain-containing protein [Caerostris darwini]|uniref:HTH_48 domain-containing protein n=1 Tax=Caerostris darwini TaxID=1538125 RepID=A0AAV4S406_9ARAC|nr:HTH_48 domain-containing protein [Caerostris darwini]
MIQQVFGEQSPSQTEIFEWLERFQSGQLSVDDDEYVGQSSMVATLKKIQQLIHEDRRQTISDLCNKVRIGYRACQRILTEKLGIHRITAKFVPMLLTLD